MKRNKHYDIREIFEQMELDLISSMHRAFYFHKREEAKKGFVWEQWQKSKLRAIEEYRRRNKKLVDSYSKPIQETINREINGNFKKKARNLSDKIKKFFGISMPEDIADKQKIKEHIKEPTDEAFFGVNEKKIETLQKVVEQDLKRAQYSVLRKMDDVYRQTIYKSQVYMQSGTVTLNKAIDMATKDFLKQGINSIKYSDGKNVNIASYAEMCLRTANHRAKLLGEGIKRDEWGVHLVVVSAHVNTCKMCEPWQGKVLIDDVFSHPSKEYIERNSKKYKLLSEAIKANLMHPNCRHNIVTYFEGITNLPKVPDREKALKTYEVEQRQRTLERQIRNWKRFEAGTCDEENKQIASNKLRRLQKDLINHINNNKELRRDRNREGLISGLEVNNSKI